MTDQVQTAQNGATAGATIGESAPGTPTIPQVPGQGFSVPPGGVPQSPQTFLQGQHPAQGFAPPGAVPGMARNPYQGQQPGQGQPGGHLRAWYSPVPAEAGAPPA